MQKEKIYQAIYLAVDEVNQFRSPEQQVEKSPDTVLMGKDGVLDSLGVVNLIVETEMAIDQLFDVTIDLADEKAMAQEDNPFRSIGRFATYIEQRLKEKVDGQFQA